MCITGYMYNCITQEFAKWEVAHWKSYWALEVFKEFAPKAEAQKGNACGFEPIIFSVAKLSGVAKTLHQAELFFQKTPGHLWPSDFRYSPLSLRIRWWTLVPAAGGVWRWNRQRRNPGDSNKVTLCLGVLFKKWPEKMGDFLGPPIKWIKKTRARLESPGSQWL